MKTSVIEETMKGGGKVNSTAVLKGGGTLQCQVKKREKRRYRRPWEERGGGVRVKKKALNC